MLDAIPHHRAIEDEIVECIWLMVDEGVVVLNVGKAKFDMWWDDCLYKCDVVYVRIWQIAKKDKFAWDLWRNFSIKNLRINIRWLQVEWKITLSRHASFQPSRSISKFQSFQSISTSCVSVSLHSSLLCELWHKFTKFDVTLHQHLWPLFTTNSLNSTLLSYYRCAPKAPGKPPKLRATDCVIWASKAWKYATDIVSVQWLGLK